MNGFLGTSASLWSDLSLVLTWVLLIVASFGAIQAHRRRFSTHCPVMAVAAFLNWIPVLVVMIPQWIGVATGAETLVTGALASAPLLHGVLGAVTQLLMTYTVTRMYWVERLPPKKPIWLMRATLTLWSLTIIGGTVVYIVGYAV
ncbi:MAG: hypothetical protein ACP5JG_05785 [Anaerolineae bacterium]